MHLPDVFAELSLVLFLLFTVSGVRHFHCSK